MYSEESVMVGKTDDGYKRVLQFTDRCTVQAALRDFEYLVLDGLIDSDKLQYVAGRIIRAAMNYGIRSSVPSVLWASWNLGLCGFYEALWARYRSSHIANKTRPVIQWTGKAVPTDSTRAWLDAVSLPRLLHNPGSDGLPADSVLRKLL